MTRGRCLGKLVEEPGGRVADITVYGQESKYSAWKLAWGNRANVIDADPGPRNGDGFRTDLHPDLKADFVPVRKNLANPPFSMSSWGGEHLQRDVRNSTLSASTGESVGARCRMLFSP